MLTRAKKKLKRAAKLDNKEHTMTAWKRSAYLAQVSDENVGPQRPPDRQQLGGREALLDMCGNHAHVVRERRRVELSGNQGER